MAKQIFASTCKNAASLRFCLFVALFVCYTAACSSHSLSLSPCLSSLPTVFTFGLGAGSIFNYMHTKGRHKSSRHLYRCSLSAGKANSTSTARLCHASLQYLPSLLSPSCGSNWPDIVCTVRKFQQLVQKFKCK